MKKQARFEIKKQERETNQSLIRRFTKRLKDSGILLSAKKRQFRKRVKSDEVRKGIVLKRIERQKEEAKLRKLGRI